MGDPKQEALDLVNEFAKRPGNGMFPRIPRSEVARGLEINIDDPGEIDQGSSGTCLMASFLYSLARTKVLDYTRFVIDLYEKGKARLNDLQIEPSQSLRFEKPSFNPRTRLPIRAVDWVPLASIRNSNQAFLRDTDCPLRAPFGLGRKSSMDDLERWFSKAGYTRVINKTSSWRSQSESSAREANQFLEQGYVVCLLLDVDIFDAKKMNLTSSSGGDHAVALASPINLSNRCMVEFEVFTWGEGRKKVPGSRAQNGVTFIGCLSLEGFLSHYYGFVAAAG